MTIVSSENNELSRVEKLKNSFTENPKDLLTYVFLTAKASGFTYGNVLDNTNTFDITSFNTETGRMAIVVKSDDDMKVVYDSIYLLFFDLTFARAIFGDQWEPHLIELARSKNKLKYITDNILIKSQVA